MDTRKQEHPRLPARRPKRWRLFTRFVPRGRSVAEAIPADVIDLTAYRQRRRPALPKPGGAA